MKKNYYYAIVIMMLASILSSCSKEFYQVLTAESQSVETQQTDMVYEDENCKITYNLWASHGNAGFIFYNKTDKNIIVNLQESFFIFNGYANNYYLDRTYVYGKSTRVGIGKSFGKSANYSETLSGTLYGTWLGYDASVSASASGAIGVSQSSAAQIQAETNASVEIKEQNKVCIPPKTAKLFYEYQILDNIYRECGLLLAPKKSGVKHLKYTNANSPIKFGNVICYKIGENGLPIVVNNDFYVADIVNITAGTFATDIKIEKDCMGKSYRASRYKTVCKEQAPNKFYIKYIQNAKNPDVY